eukprot:363145-Chlamydomonas_euryale.AAC.9
MSNFVLVRPLPLSGQDAKSTRRVREFWAPGARLLALRPPPHKCGCDLGETHADSAMDSIKLSLTVAA